MDVLSLINEMKKYTIKCNLEFKKQKRSESKEKRQKNEKEYNKIYNLNNKDKIKEYNKEYHLINKQKRKEYHFKNKENRKEYNIINKDRIKNYAKNYNKKRRQIDPLFKLKDNISKSIRTTIRRKGHSKKSRTFEILGCSYEDFKQHLERQFTKGMTWENQGQWHLDHIYPISLAKDEQELIKLNHYTNFQPLWAKDNLEKQNKIIPNTQIKLI
jgi:hypothetical protein